LVAVVGRAFSGPVAERFGRLVGVKHLQATGKFPEAGSTITGFRVAHTDPPRELMLEGGHRFSSYALGFRVDPFAQGCVVTATTWAEFPGAAGGVYRALVIGTRAHVVALRRVLRAVERRALARRS